MFRRVWLQGRITNVGVVGDDAMLSFELTEAKDCVAACAVFGESTVDFVQKLEKGTPVAVIAFVRKLSSKLVFWAINVIPISQEDLNNWPNEVEFIVTQEAALETAQQLFA